MASPNDDQVAALTAQLEGLEKECQGLLGALRYAKTVRLILLAGLLIFVGVFSFLFYRLYQDITTNRLAEIQAEFTAKQDEFIEPLTRELFHLVEDTRPEVTKVVFDRASEDAPRYMKAFDNERETMIANLETYLETKLRDTYAQVLDEHQEILAKEFPELLDKQKLQQVRNNMENAYQLVGKRYYVDYMREELKELVAQIDEFPPAKPKQAAIPVGEQVATEFLEMVRMMLVHSENYVMDPDETPIPGTSGQATPASATKAADGDKKAGDEKSGDDAKKDDADEKKEESDDTKNDDDKSDDDTKSDGGEPKEKGDGDDG